MSNNDEEVEITFDQATLREFIAAYQKAKESGLDQFVFRGADVLTSYAKYLIQFLTPKFE